MVAACRFTPEPIAGPEAVDPPSSTPLILKVALRLLRHPRLRRLTEHCPSRAIADRSAQKHLLERQDPANAGLRKGALIMLQAAAIRIGFERHGRAHAIRRQIVPFASAVSPACFRACASL